MEPTGEIRVTLNDVLDRLLDKGLAVNADIVISVAGIPLVGVNLRAAIAGMETMLSYGMMKDWDESIRGLRDAGAKTRLAVGGEKPGLETRFKGGTEKVPAVNR